MVWADLDLKIFLTDKDRNRKDKNQIGCRVAAIGRQLFGYSLSGLLTHAGLVFS
jgi:hypothetical protein